MALKANRVGVRSDQVDTFGRVSSKSFFRKLLDRLPVWVDLPVWKGGTEQLLPVNDDEPETSPILADIDYPDGLRKDQYFTYRESPTEVDGTAHITGIRGNTLVWNQLAKTLSSSNYSALRATASYSNGVCTITTTYANTICGIYITSANFGAIVGHKYLFMCTVNPSITKTFRLGFDSSTTLTDELPVTANKENLLSRIQVATSSDALVLYLRCDAIGDTAIIKNVMAFDLTKMFGAGNEPTTVAEFTALFPLSYYAYNTGTLLSFTGTGIKTVGFNQWDEEWEVGGYNTSDGTKTTDNTRIRSKNYIRCLPNNLYVVSVPATIIVFYYDGAKNYLGYVGVTNNTPFRVPSDACYMNFFVATSYGTTYKNDICISISSSENGKYEPYTTSTTIIPTDTYFPTGMKSAGTVYDELVPTKATTRIGAVDLGSLTWALNDATNHIFEATITDMKPMANYQENFNFVSSMYTPSVLGKADMPDLSVRQTSNNSNHIFVKNTTYSDATAFKTAMDGVYLYYELATEVVEPTMVFE